MTNKHIREKLEGLADEKYKAFQLPLMPGISPETVIGIRTPILRNFAKNLTKEETEIFLSDLPHRYYEENNLHGFLIEKVTDFHKAVELIEKFIPYIDNWATCDGFVPRAFKKNKDKLVPYIDKWIATGKTYSIRYAVGLYMKLYLDEDFDVSYMEKVAKIRSEEYYVNMMIAWYFATALAKQYDTAVRYIEENRLAPWVHNKTISKARESFRVGREAKEYLNKLKI